jgi:monoamine oxidase
MGDIAGVIVIGAGAAGLAATAELGRAGLSVIILEARDRVGGRIFTQVDPICHVPIEYGAEFIHGLPPETWEPLQKQNVPITEVDGESWCVAIDCMDTDKGHLRSCDFFSDIDNILKTMDANSADESFLSFLNRRFPESGDPKRQEARKHALSYVSGFNAADPDRVGVHWLVKGMEAEAKIEGHRAFRSLNGYVDLLDILRQQATRAGVTIHTKTIVHSIQWTAGHVDVIARRGAEPCSFSAKRALVTLPLGVLQVPPDEADDEAGSVQFVPPLPSRRLDVLKKLEMGKAFRVTLRFRNRFWQTIPSPEHDRKTLLEMSFLFTDDDHFPTWWTRMPERTPIITGWAPFRCADRLAGKSRSFVIDQALQALSGALKIDSKQLGDLLDDAYFHDWQTDPFSRGAYSYGAVGSDGAQEALATPIENTLFFAGEATDTTGHNGTVHGAIASGKRAAQEILQTLP